MAADTIAKVRSPYIVEIVGTLNDSTKVELFIWNNSGSIPASPNYTLEKPIISTAVGKAQYDVSPYIREFISHDTYTETNIEATADSEEYCFCSVKAYKNGVLQTGGGAYTEELICFDGYGYHEEGQNPVTSQGVLLDEGTYLISDTGNPGGIYRTDVGTTGIWSVLYTGLNTGGTVTFNLSTGVTYIPYTYAPLTQEPVRVEIKLGGFTQFTYKFIPTCEDKYTAHNCDFVNKYGVWQRIVFFKASRKNYEMSNTSYNLMPADTNYDTTEARKRVFNVNGVDKITVNTGWVEESYSDVIKQLMNSETIKLDNKPVNILTKSIELQEGINKNNINYTLDFEYAYNAINYNI